MCSSSCTFLVLFPLLLHLFVALVYAQDSNNTIQWKTLNGEFPFVVARGGFSGLFPDSSETAYRFTLQVSLKKVILWCDVQLTKDGVGICLPHLRLDNGTDALDVLGANRSSVYLVNGVRTNGLFTLDFTFRDLENVTHITSNCLTSGLNWAVTQGIYSRPNQFDGNQFLILTPEYLGNQFNSLGIWLNFQHNAFYTQQNLSMRNYVLTLTKRIVVSYVSSPEVGFLTSIASRINRGTTKLIFRVLGPTDIEVTMNQTYDSLLRNLTFIKTFASGILVPKTYIWPIDKDGYIQSATSLVSDAHKVGLEVFASEFSNDALISYNYSYDPITEYLAYVGNGNFSVDGVLTDFPITPSIAIGCFAHMDDKEKSRDRPLIISKFGASGDYPACTDLAYSKAISDGVEVIDCPVQMAKDGTPFCMSDINLINSTTIAQTSFSNRSKTVTEISPTVGIFAFDLTWKEIQGLTPSILNPSANYLLYRNPRFRNSGKFLSLSYFLALAKNASSLSGVLISIKNAAYLAKEHGLSVTDAVLDSLSKAGYDDQSALKVLIQSPNSSVLKTFKDEKKNYELVYEVGDSISDVRRRTLMNIKSFADSVTISKDSVYSQNQLFLNLTTGVVTKFQNANLSVYVETFSNEFVTQAWDFFSDPTIEINTYSVADDVDGVVTDFPKTSARYKKNRCSRMPEAPKYMNPVRPGDLLHLVTEEYMPPPKAPSLILDNKDVDEPPLPPITSLRTPSRNGQPELGAGAGFLLLNLAILSIALLPF